MKRFIYFLLLVTTAATAQPQYPSTKRVAQVDTLHEVAVADPYRWFENDTTADVKAWVKAQNAVTFGYLHQIPFRKKLRERIGELENYVQYSQPWRIGDYYIFDRSDGKQPQSVTYIQKGLTGQPSVLVDPNTLSKDRTTRVYATSDSKDGRYVALITQRADSDWQQITVMELATKRSLPDTIRWAMGSNAWWRGKGFYYSRYPEPKKGEELTARRDAIRCIIISWASPKTATS